MTDKQREWQKLLEAWKLSGMSAAAWCRQENIDRYQMYYWKRKFREIDAEASLDWVSLSDIAPGDDHHGFVTIKIDQLSIEIRPQVDRQLLADIIHVLRYR